MVSEFMCVAYTFLTGGGGGDDNVLGNLLKIEDHVSILVLTNDSLI